MTQSFIALLPVFIVILVGYGLRRSGLIAEEHWTAVDHVCYYVLFPAIIFKEIAAADFSNVPVWSMALAMMLGISTMFALLLILRRPLISAIGSQRPAIFKPVSGGHALAHFYRARHHSHLFRAIGAGSGRPQRGGDDAASQHRECGGDFGSWFRRQDECARPWRFPF